MAAGRRGPAGSNAVLGMLVFLGAEAMFFAGLVSAYVVLRGRLGFWPPADQPRLPLGVTAANTLVLLGSGWTMIRANTAIGGGRRARLAGELARTALLGAVFLGIQGAEWVRLVRHGMRLRGSVFGALFTTLIGCHALHALGGLVAVLVALRVARIGPPSPGLADTVTAVTLYWLFVVGLWPVLFGLVYLW